MSSTPTLKPTSYTIRTAVRSRFPSTLPKCKYSGEWYTACRQSPRLVPENDRLEHRAERTAATPHTERDRYQVQGRIRPRTRSPGHRCRVKLFAEDVQRGCLFSLLDQTMHVYITTATCFTATPTPTLGIVLVRNTMVYNQGRPQRGDKLTMIFTSSSSFVSYLHQSRWLVVCNSQNRLLAVSFVRPGLAHFRRTAKQWAFAQAVNLAGVRLRRRA